MSIQADFSAALRDPALPPPAGLRAWNSTQVDARFAVYRNNGLAALVAALEESFPVTRALVGEPFFREMARCFVQAQPPRSPVLIDYGDALPAFIADFAPARSLPYLPDVAQLEALRVQAWHAADATPLPAADFAAVLGDVARLPALRLYLHPALAVLHSDYAVYSLWAAHQDVLDIATVDPSQPEALLVLRPELSVEVLAIDPDCAAFLRALQDGLPLGAAVEATLRTHPGFDLTQGLAILITHRALCGFDYDNTETPS